MEAHRLRYYPNAAWLGQIFHPIMIIFVMLE
jgi:hypothetical protein